MRLQYKPALVARFWAKVDRSVTGCWMWRACHRNGYGVIGNRGGSPNTIYAHILSYTLRYGPVPPGLLVLHRCDVRGCVNPDHLYAGTFSDNIRDAWARGRRTLRQKKDSRGHYLPVESSQKPVSP